MTGETSRPPQRKRLALYALLAATILTAAWITYFLVTLDLNNYRKEAELELSALLSLPVTLGEIKYNLHDTNLALQVDGLRLGDESSNIQVEAKSLLINLKWMGLIERDFKFAKISLIQPQVLLKAAKSDQTDGLDLSPTISSSLAPDLLQKIHIEALEITEGTLLIEAAHTGQAAQHVEFSEVTAEFIDLRINEPLQFDVKGRLNIPGQKGKSLCHLHGEGTLGLDQQQRVTTTFDLDLDVKDLELERFRKIFASRLSKDMLNGRTDLHLHLNGEPDKGIDFQVSLSSDKMALRPAPDYANPVVLKDLLASGRLQLRGDQPGIEELSLQIDESRLAGRINWTPPSEPFTATIRVLNSDLAIERIKRWLPNNQGLLQRIHQSLRDQGSMHIAQAQITLRERQEEHQVWQVDKIDGEFTELAWVGPNTPEVEIDSLPFEITASNWEVVNARGKLGSLQLAMNGSGERNGNSLTLSALDLNGEARAETFLGEWQIPDEILKTSGRFSIEAHLEGPFNRLNYDLQANLSQLNIRHASGLELPPGPGDKLALHGTITPQKINLDHGSLKWATLKGHASGSYRPAAPDSLDLDALLTVNDLASVTEALPLLKKLQLHGQADLSIKQKGLPKNNRPELTLTLREAGLRATRFIADLSHINGRIKLTETGLIGENLQVQLGKAPLTVQAQLIDFTNPRLLLDARANAIHADDLIFHSDSAMLRDIDGHLEIDRDGLTFAPVEVRLDGGTSASVRGTISFHPPFDVMLEISSGFANVAEVVQLWTDRAAKPRTPTEAKQQSSQAKPTVTIKAQVKSGDLYGMRFHDANATITPTHERLTIHPFHLSVGEGTSDAQVITEFATADQPTRLRISGHAENVDALEVYRELLNQKAILRGKLRGDFFISGEAGANYLPSSYGNFSIQVQDGVLNEFPVLSKIFSLLNVSQLFALQLPDMDLEGMPFNDLRGNFELNKGILRSENLKVASDAMNQEYQGEMDLVNKEVAFSVAIHPLGTVDKVISSIPVAGWLLTGEDKALLTAHFSVKGQMNDVSVSAKPLDTLVEPTIGLLKRTLQLPFKLVEDPQILWGGDGTGQTPKQD